jgi:micrococcal nuclease
MNRPVSLATLAALALAALAGCASTGAAPPPPASSTAPTTTTAPSSATQGGTLASVVRVVDGDTIVVNDGMRSATVRLLSIDTPESVSPTVPDECWGKEASEHLRTKLPVSTSVHLTADPTQDDKDRYGRLLRYVDKDGEDVNLWLVKDGDAAAYKLRSGPAPQRYADYLEAQKAAQAAHVGQWGKCQTTTT